MGDLKLIKQETNDTLAKLGLSFAKKQKRFLTEKTESACVVYKIGNHSRLLEYTDEFWQMLGYVSADEFRMAGGEDFLALVHPSDRAKFLRSIRCRKNDGTMYRSEYRLMAKNGTPVEVLESGRIEETDNGESAAWSMIISTMPMKRMRERFLFREFFDPITGLFNRRAFGISARDMIDAHPDIVFEIMIVDISRFKVVNEMFGEKTGNQILKRIAKCLRDENESLTVYGRLYADHFIVCFPSSKVRRRAYMDALDKLTAVPNEDYRLDIRYGVYRVIDPSLSIGMMCDRAELALKRAKNGTVQAFAEYDEGMHKKVVGEQYIVNNMEKALRNKDFQIYVQPKYSLTTETVVGGEALVRWKNEEKGMISPGEFIPVFEQNGFVFKLDYYVWEETCKFLRNCLDHGIVPHPISVNISRMDFYNENIVPVIVNLVKKYHIPPQLLELELTESAYMEDPKKIIRMSSELQRRGFKILMDDFGSGYSSLNMLKDMSVDILKLDLKVLDSKDHTERGNNILSSIVHMAGWLHMSVIAEGVENREQVEFLRTTGCDCVQGFLYSRPVPLEEYGRMAEPDLSEGTIA